MDTPLRVTFTLTSPMVSPGNPIHLDSLLAYAVTRQQLSRIVSGRYVNKTNNDGFVRSLAEKLPLGRETKDGEWVWKASALMPTEVLSRSMRMFTRKQDHYDFAERVKSTNVTLSTRATTMLDKNIPFAIEISKLDALPTPRLLFYPVEHVREVVAWCIGDQDLIESLLSPDSGYITCIGKNKRCNHGNILSVTVEEDASAHELWKRRVLPWQEEGYVAVDAAFQPPYWAPENRKSAFMPVDL